MRGLLLIVAAATLGYMAYYFALFLPQQKIKRMQLEKSATEQEYILPPEKPSVATNGKFLDEVELPQTQPSNNEIDLLMQAIENGEPSGLEEGLKMLITTRPADIEGLGLKLVKSYGPRLVVPVENLLGDPNYAADDYASLIQLLLLEGSTAAADSSLNQFQNGADELRKAVVVAIRDVSQININEDSQRQFFTTLVNPSDNDEPVFMWLAAQKLADNLTSEEKRIWLATGFSLLNRVDTDATETTTESEPIARTMLDAVNENETYRSEVKDLLQNLPDDFPNRADIIELFAPPEPTEINEDEEDLELEEDAEPAVEPTAPTPEQ